MANEVINETFQVLRHDSDSMEWLYVKPFSTNPEIDARLMKRTLKHKGMGTFPAPELCNEHDNAWLYRLNLLQTGFRALRYSYFREAGDYAADEMPHDVDGMVFSVSRMPFGKIFPAHFTTSISTPWIVSRRVV